MKSSYYTGYEDLDKELVKLYDEQTRIERKLRVENLTDGDYKAYANVIREQDSLLFAGRMRDKENS